MSRLNGFGTTLLGISDRDSDGNVYATTWVTIAYLPILPLKRQKIKVSYYHKVETAFTIISREPLSFASIFKTYLLGWIIYPILIFTPLILGIKEIWSQFGFSEEYHIPYIIFGITWMLAMIYILYKRYDKKLYPKE